MYTLPVDYLVLTAAYSILVGGFIMPGREEIRIMEEVHEEIERLFREGVLPLWKEWSKQILYQSKKR